MSGPEIKVRLERPGCNPPKVQPCKCAHGCVCKEYNKEYCCTVTGTCKCPCACGNCGWLYEEYFEA